MEKGLKNQVDKKFGIHENQTVKQNLLEFNGSQKIHWICWV